MVHKIKQVLASPYVRYISWALTGLSLVLLGIWLLTHRQELTTIHWAVQWPVLLLLVGMYGFSPILSFAVWHSCMRSVRQISWARDLELYAYSNLSRRLPSGLGYLFVRTVGYHVEGLDPGVVLYLSAQEFFLQVICGALVAVSSLLLTAGAVDRRLAWVLSSLLVVPLVLIIRPTLLTDLLGRLGGNAGAAQVRLSRRLILGWGLAYVLTWLNGGVMLHLLQTSMAGGGGPTLIQSIGLWAFSASLGLIGSMMPLGQFARDATLTLLLQSYLSLPLAVTIAIAFRLVLTVGDVFWSCFLFLFGRLTQKHYCR